jgi:hypothetical protein
MEMHEFFAQQSRPPSQETGFSISILYVELLANALEAHSAKCNIEDSNC